MSVTCLHNLQLRESLCQLQLDHIAATIYSCNTCVYRHASYTLKLICGEPLGTSVVHHYWLSGFLVYAQRQLKLTFDKWVIDNWILT